MANLERVIAFTKFRGTNLLVKICIYTVLASLGFVFLYPLLYMVSTSVMGTEDLISPYVVWIPYQFNLYNYYLASIGLRFWSALQASAILSIGGALGQTLSCALIGYGLARYKFPGRNIVFILVLFTFIVPPHVIMIPLYIQFSRYGWIFTYLPFLVPCFLGQGLRGAIFVIIYRQFFATLPGELDDSARIEGLGGFKIFTKIMLPISRSAMLVVFLFSFVWNWNDYYLPSVFLRSESAPLSVRLSRLWTDIRQYIEIVKSGQVFSSYEDWWRNPYFLAIMNRNEALGMAASVLVICFPLLIYFLLQRFFTESIERTGIVG